MGVACMWVELKCLMGSFHTIDEVVQVEMFPSTLQCCVKIWKTQSTAKSCSWAASWAPVQNIPAMTDSVLTGIQSAPALQQGHGHRRLQLVQVCTELRTYIPLWIK